jgi:hypothetical protein
MAMAYSPYRQAAVERSGRSIGAGGVADGKLLRDEEIILINSSCLSSTKWLCGTVVAKMASFHRVRKMNQNLNWSTEDEVGSLGQRESFST